MKALQKKYTSSYFETKGFHHFCLYSRCISFECEELSSGNRRKRGSLPPKKLPFPSAALQRGIKILSHWAGSWELREEEGEIGRGADLLLEAPRHHFR